MFNKKSYFGAFWSRSPHIIDANNSSDLSFFVMKSPIIIPLNVETPPLRPRGTAMPNSKDKFISEHLDI